MNLVESFKESIAIQKENDMILQLAIKQLGLVVKSKPVSHKKLQSIFKSLDKTVKLRIRIDNIQSDLSGQLILQHQKIGSDADGT